MRIVVNGNPALRRKSEAVNEINAEIRNFAGELSRSLAESETPGVGLAAPQVGVNLRMIVIDTRSDDGIAPDASPGELLLEPMMPVVLLNPAVLSASEETDETGEGCLSLPGVSGRVRRPSRIILQAQLLNGQPLTVECAHLLARCLQHEIDHLDGILFCDRISASEQKRAKAQMECLERREKSLLRLNGEA